MILSSKKVLIVCLDLLCLAVMPFLPERHFATACILFSDLYILLLVIGQIRGRLQNPAIFFLGLTWFLFLLSGATFSLLNGQPPFVYLDMEITAVNQGCLIVLTGSGCLTTVCVLCHGLVLQPVLRVYRPARITEPTQLQKLAICVLFFVAALCKGLVIWENAAISRTAGYHMLYLQRSSALPVLVHHIAALFYFSLTLFLACRFRARLTGTAYVVILAFSVLLLITGDRTEAVCSILLLICYTIWRCRSEPRFFRHRTLDIVLLIVLLPLIPYLLQSVAYFRIGEAVPRQYREQLLEFIQDQGITLKLPVHAVQLREALRRRVGGSFLWGQLRAYAEQNALSRALFHIPKIAENTVEMAQSGYCYASAISWLSMPDSYLRGIGAGTCYLAELYHDGSWPGVVAGSVLTAFLLHGLNRLPSMGWLAFALYLNCIRNLFMLPRGPSLHWLTETLSVPNLLLLALVLLIGAISRPMTRGGVSP